MFCPRKYPVRFFKELSLKFFVVLLKDNNKVKLYDLKEQHMNIFDINDDSYSEDSYISKFNVAQQKHSRHKVNAAVANLSKSCVYVKPPENLSQQIFFAANKVTAYPTFEIPKIKEIQSVSEKNFDQAKATCKYAKLSASFVTDPYAPLPPSCAPLTEGMSKEQKGKFIQHEKNAQKGVEMLTAMAPIAGVGMTSDYASKAVSYTIESFCHQNQFNEAMCHQVGSAGKFMLDLVPNFIKEPLSNANQAYQHFVNKKADEYSSNFQIDRQDTEHFMGGIVHLSTLGTFTIAKYLKPTPAKPGRQLFYCKGYEECKDNFIKAREFEGTLKKDLYLVQYHTDAPLNKGRSLQWFTTTNHANKLSTVEEVMNQLALLPSCNLS